MASPKTDKPNILHIITDQQSAFAMGCSDNPHVKTPNMDRLAAEGIRFDRTYVANPLCVCSRASMLTGLQSSRTVFLDPAGFPRQWYPDELRRHTIGWLMRDAGYDVAYAGKWHTMWMGDPADHGYRTLLPENLSKTTNYYFGQEPETTHATVQYLEQEHDKPFYLTSSLIQPHGICFWGCHSTYPHTEHPPWPEGKDPWDITDPDGKAHPVPPLDMDPDEFIKSCPPLPENFEIPDDEPEIIQNRFRDPEPRYPTPKMNFQGKGTYTRNWSEQDIWRARLWTYYRFVEYVDWNLGKIFDALQASGQWDNTIIVFTSDHGDMSGGHKLRLKQCLYEECIRVPLIIAGPGISSDKVDREHIMDNCVDWMPTLCDYAGIEPPETCDGVSWRPLLEGNDVSSWREQHIVECNEGLSLRKGKYKYTYYAQSPKHPEQLFDMQADPSEMTNLAEKPEYESILCEYRDELTKWKTNRTTKPAYTKF